MGKALESACAVAAAVCMTVGSAPSASADGAAVTAAALAIAVMARRRAGRHAA